MLNIKKEALLNNNKSSEYCAPLTSFDWNETDPSIIGTSSIDTTCTIWDVHTQQARTQLIAHDREVFDIAFARGKDVFASVGADGSVRMFDLRSLVNSTIIYESPELEPLLRLEWNKQVSFIIMRQRKLLDHGMLLARFLALTQHINRLSVLLSRRTLITWQRSW